MKKLLLVLAIGSLFAVACNDGGSAEAEKTADTAATAPTTVDTTAAPAPTVDTAAATVDTTKKADTTKKK
ncbi:hypothetical protein [Longitalea luteola]|uniref:hypothetical protein n=1 Tax=Longitalea luteola TaxID=2812563 RepID=UPI001A96C5A1|nr:hypothetical protein [Longitalea luteola]